MDDQNMPNLLELDSDTAIGKFLKAADPLEAELRASKNIFNAGAKAMWDYLDDCGLLKHE